MRLPRKTARTWIIVLAAVGCVVGGAVWIKRSRDGANAVERLARAKTADALMAYNAALVLFRGGEIDYSDACEWSRRVAKSELETAKTRAGRITALRSHLGRIRDIGVIVDQRLLTNGVSPRWHVSRHRYYLREGELWLAREE